MTKQTTVIVISDIKLRQGYLNDIKHRVKSYLKANSMAFNSVKIRHSSEPLIGVRADYFVWLDDPNLWTEARLCRFRSVVLTRSTKNTVHLVFIGPCVQAEIDPKKFFNYALY